MKNLFNEFMLMLGIAVVYYGTVYAMEDTIALCVFAGVAFIGAAFYGAMLTDDEKKGK